VHYVRPQGEPKAKVFKMAELTLEPGQNHSAQCHIWLKQMTTRKHHPGRHLVALRVNGFEVARGHFDLT
jgi:hypothetical protein